MNHIFWGFFFIYIQLNITFNQHVVDVIPAFVGYILLQKGLSAMEGESPRFGYAKPFAVGMAIYSALIWVGDLLGITSVQNFITLFLSLIGTVLSLYIAYVIVAAIRDTERLRLADLNGQNLHNSWVALAVINLFSLLIHFIPFLAIPILLVGLVSIVLFLINIRRSQRRYENLPPVYDIEQANDTPAF